MSPAYQKYIAIRDDLFKELTECRKKKVPNTQTLKKLHYVDLKIIELSKYCTEVYIFSKGCCDECDALDMLTMSVEDALTYSLLPYTGCTRKTGCCCRYLSRAVRNEKGRLIMKPNT